MKSIAVSKLPTEDTPPELVPLKIELHRIVCDAECLLKQIAKRDARYKQLQHVPIDRVSALTEPVRWGYECKTVRWYGKTYHFTDSQAEVLRILRRCHRKGVVKVRERTLCQRLDIDDEGLKGPFRLRSRFMSANVPHIAYGVVVHSADGWWWIGRE
jgi:hypothetical protein